MKERIHLQSLIRIIQDSSIEESVRGKAALELVALGTPAIESLIDLSMSMWFWHIRESVSNILSQVGLPSVNSVINRMLKHRDYNIRGRAMVILERIGPIAVPELIQIHNDKDVDIHQRVARILENIEWQPHKHCELLVDFINHTNFALRQYATEVLETMLASITVVIFGSIAPAIFNQFTLTNPDVSRLSIPASNVCRIEIHTETYNFHQVERFMTYAINYIGQKHLKKNVETYIYDNPDQLHPNLQNIFRNLCRSVRRMEY